MKPDGGVRWFALVVLCLGDRMIVLDSTILNGALPPIQEDLGFSKTSLAWVVNAYMLTFGGFLLLAALNGGYHAAFQLSAACVALAAFLAVALLRLPRATATATSRGHEGTPARVHATSGEIDA